MYFFFLIVFYYSLNNIVLSDSVDIKLMKSEDGLETPVISVIKIEKGTNFSLICKFVGNNTDGKIIWGKMKSKSKFICLGDNSANFNFTSITKSSEGVYFCVSPLHKLYKAVSVIVRSRVKEKSVVLRKKRLLDDYDADMWNIIQKDESDWLEILQQDLKNIKEEERRRKEEERMEMEIEEDEKIFKEEIGFGIAGIFIVVGITIYVLYIRNKAKHQIQDDIPDVENHTMGNRIRQLHDEVVNMHTRSPSVDIINGPERYPLSDYDVPPSYEEATRCDRTTNDYNTCDITLPKCKETAL